TEPAWKQLQEWLGPHFFLPDGSLDRKKLARLVFTDEKARKKLNSIVHPHVTEQMFAERDCLKKEHPRAIFIWDVPLLIETGMHEAVDIVILVAVPKEIQIKRLIDRDRLSLEEACQRLNSQMSLEEKKPYADLIIGNSGSLAHTYWQLEKIIWPRLLQLEEDKHKSQRETIQ
ncbi:MAG: dephospho-CoA kinase, partial [Firmicutes bacterium]|nr:dephospho-CoA kinase [Bacillota bacterium]